MLKQINKLLILRIMENKMKLNWIKIEYMEENKVDAMSCDMELGKDYFVP